ncbi:TonB-dependent receptor [Komagataeibacter rhaeticus]|uniref:TonB-dependent receptor n=1 Tax=Komagataeibacter rhaeticus TaxID=215221 RepID=UPI00296FCC48|nr:TonB-dependent receptor [Komagataeibacter rhaeticus]
MNSASRTVKYTLLSFTALSMAGYAHAASPDTASGNGTHKKHVSAHSSQSKKQAVDARNPNQDSRREEMLVKADRIQSATYQSPTNTPLTATQPTFVMSKHYIENNLPATANYDTVAAIAPSVMSISPNGPGLSESANLVMRGFSDGQYDVTFDGIPIAQTNDNTHHSTSYYAAHDLGQVEVDAGPGDATTVGFATFGGRIGINSKDPKKKMGAEAYASAGSWNTYNYGAEFDTGEIKGTHGGRLFADVEGTTSGGYVNYAAQRRSNYMIKYIQPLGEHTTLTVSGMYNHIDQHAPPGATRAQIAKYGSSFGLSNDPTNQNYEGYNRDAVQTDLEYIGINSDLGSGWTIEDKAYTFAYFHQPGDSGKDVNGTTPNGTVYSATDVPGTRMKMDYRAWGNVLKLKKRVSIVDFQTGVWVDHQSNGRIQYNLDWTLDGKPAPNSAKAITRQMHDQNLSIQPFIQADVHITKALTFSAGFKYASFERDLEATVNQTTKKPMNYSQTYTAPLPSFNLHYMITPKWSSYIQVARGFLAPSLTYFYVGNPADNQVSAERTWNYQIGTSYQSHRWSVGGDFYYIDFSNMIGSRLIGQNTQYYNMGSVRYYGAEVQGTVYLAKGISLFANASYNQARLNSDNSWVPRFC